MAPPCSGRVAGALLGCLQCRVTVLKLPGATDASQHKEAPRSWLHLGSATAQEGSERSPSCHGHAGASPWHQEGNCLHVPCSSQAQATSSSYSRRAWAVPRNPRRSDSSMGCTRACSGSPRCSPGEARSRENGTVTGTTSRAAVPTAPSRSFMCVPAQSHRKAPFQEDLGGSLG